MRARQAIPWICAVALLVAQTRLIAGRGAFSFRAPLTVVSNSPQRDWEPYLLFLKAIGQRLPKGSDIAVVVPVDPGLGMEYLVAVGQLPDARVLPQSALSTPGGSLPSWAASFRVRLSDDRYRLVEEVVADGFLFQRVP
jgi:hypothetical protein